MAGSTNFTCIYIKFSSIKVHISTLHGALVPHLSSETADNTEVFYHHLFGSLWNSFPSPLVPTMDITSDFTKDRLDAEIKKQ